MQTEAIEPLEKQSADNAEKQKTNKSAKSI